MVTRGFSKTKTPRLPAARRPPLLLTMGFSFSTPPLARTYQVLASFIMPTFQSIGIHPELRTRLVTLAGAGTGDQEPQLIETPQALLSRNPAQLRLLDRDTGISKPISVLQVRKLRDEVAHALIKHSDTGKRVKRLRHAVQQHFPDDPLDESIDGGSHVGTTATPSLAVEGFASALDLVRYDALQRSRPDNGSLSTGCRALDDMLALPTEYTAVLSPVIPTSEYTAPVAGLARGYVTQIAGPSSSGKTQVALHLAAQQAAPTCSTWYLCHAGAANYATRLSQVAAVNGGSAVLDRTIFRTVTDEYQALAALSELKAILDEAGGNEDSPVTDTNAATMPITPSLLVLDSASTCMSTENDDLMARVALTLKGLARQYDLAVLILNGTVTDRSDATAQSHKPALGQAWKSAADVHVWFQSVSSPDAAVKVVQARLDRHPAKRCFGAQEDPIVCTFGITSAGVKDMPGNTS